jgi:peptidoglycan/xylan/chitin deacetylase (PgdA/CDA1 family)
MRMSKTDLVAQATEATGLGSLARRFGSWRGVLALTYHRVGLPDHSYYAASWDATPAMFEEQVRLLVKEFDVIRPTDLGAALRGGRGRYVLITFDDAYRDNFEEAFPILKRCGASATFFITTGFVDGRQLSWWDEIGWMVHMSPKTELQVDGWVDHPLSLRGEDREVAVSALSNRYKALSEEKAGEFMDVLAEATGSGRHPIDSHDPWMTWDDIRELQAAGMHIGGHTVNHQILAQLPGDEQEREITGCKRRIEAELGEPMISLSYPDGGRDSFDGNTRRILAENDVEFGFSYYGGYRRFSDWDPYDVRRRWLSRSVTRDRFALMLTLPQVFTWR